MFGRRYSEGLQAIEAKGAESTRESKTLATITFQNYLECTINWQA